MAVAAKEEVPRTGDIDGKTKPKIEDADADAVLEGASKLEPEKQAAPVDVKPPPKKRAKISLGLSDSESSDED
eukprot:5901540-Prorocentrum_lima.AAC.1